MQYQDARHPNVQASPCLGRDAEEHDKDLESEQNLRRIKPNRSGLKLPQTGTPSWTLESATACNNMAGKR